MTPPVARLLLRPTPAIAPISHRALLSVTGSQATQFLNGLLSSSVQDPPKNQFSSFLHAQGRVMYDLFLYATSNGYLLEYDSRTSEAPSLLSYLKRHVLRSKVKIRDASEEFDVWASWGSPRDTIWDTTKRQWNWARSGAVEPVWDSAHEWPWGTAEHVIHDRRGVNMGRRLLVRKGDRPQEATTHDIKPTDAYTLHRILQGVPEGVVDIPPMQAFPMDSNLDVMGGLDFRKGCYVGQELTVRTYHTGVIRKRIVPVTIHQMDDQTALASCSFPDSLVIKPINSNAEISRPPPRGSGKLLSTHSGVGLALMRLEHLAGAEKSDLKFELVDSDSSKWQVSPWWPDWWPSGSPPSAEE